MRTEKTDQTRKKFLLWGAAALSSLTLFKSFSNVKKPKKETVKMLTQDGKLVEIDIDKTYSSKREMVTDMQLKNWVTKKKI